MLARSYQKLREAVRKSELKWRYYDNLKPVVSYRFSRKPALCDEAKRVLDDLNRDGIAITSANALLGPNSHFGALAKTVDQYQQELAGELEAARANSSEPEREKTFMFSYVVGRRQLRTDDVLVRFAVQQPILDLVNAYFGMFTHLRFINVWHTFNTSSPEQDSQLWHRDRDDRYIIKVFVYLSDVDESAGPFTYAPGTHLKGGLRAEPKSRIERPGGPARTDDSEMAKVISPERWIKARGPAGTIVFADTRGYHCGGRSRERDRVMAINMFASSATAERADGQIERVEGDRAALSPQQVFALYA
jgi:hypothetical protein